MWYIQNIRKCTSDTEKKKNKEAQTIVLYVLYEKWNYNTKEVCVSFQSLL